ncbi:uncharacterized protein CCR75_000122 [Bremia lactucae]|uniref:Reverse transcriptase zinc-binding domain-containing protein n=1 Tax=Bremia lactucae TaxID=4779 RepID=A0A976IHQ1_BRELC|nr:hypothetical protein CCR75_000122 [Bremia lactucae]
MVAIQETKFNKKDSLQTSDHFIHVADSGARCFWSDTTSPVFNERHGVGLILSSASPFGEVEDLTALVYKDQLRNRYLLLKTSLGTSTVFLHVIYAPDEPPRRGDFFRALPVGFNWNGAEGENDSKHIVLGDFNVTMDNFLDQASPSQLHPGAGREEMCDWLDALGLLDAWRFVNPDTRDYTSPTRKNRLDYCFLTANLLEVHLASINHVRDQKWHNEDHIPVAFRLQAKILPNLKRAPWRCPPWLLRDFEVVQYLRESVEHLASRLRLFQGSNPGCLLDEHKRADCIYLRRRWLELRCADSRDMALRVLAVNDALDLYNTTLTDCDKSALEQAQADLKAFRATIHDRNTASKFAADLHLSERSSRHFFRAPQQDCLRSPITEFQDDDGSVTEDPIKIGDGHRKFWGGLFQSTSPDLQHLRNASYQPIHVDYAQDFLTLVQDYAAASGLRLNVHKTSIMPFTRQIDRAKLDRLRLTTSLKVLTPTETVVLLGVLQGASVTAKQRFSDTISKLRARCAIWKYRARTLRGKVVLLQNIILPIMWYTASVTCVPASVLQTVEIIIRNFVHSKDTNSVNAAVGKFDKAWIYASVATGGLGLTPTKIFVQAMHLKTLRDALAAIYASNQSPRWVTPALHLFTKAMSSLGAGFDILYAPIKGHQWTDLPDFWRSTLRIWATQHMIHESTVWKRYSQVMPIWYNRYFTFGKAGTPLAEVSKSTIGSLKALGVNRLQDFLEFHGGFATKELLYTLLPSSVFARPASRTRLVNDTLARLNLITPPIGPIYGPFRPPAIECATHAWAFGDQLVINMTNRDFVQLLLKARSCKTIPDLRLDHLQLSGVVPPADTWKFELRFDRHVLPVCSDLKFRLQHNALGFRYKFRWRTEVATSTTCVHGCSAIEDARHLFWTCNVAEHQWGIFLLPFKEFVIGNIDWKMIVFPGLIKLTPTTLLLYGAYAVHATFTIVRCCILRALWLHRNKRLYNPELATAPDFVRHHAWAYMQLHLHQLRKHATSQGITRRIRLIDKVEIGLRNNFSG